MELRVLRYFLMVAREENITRAANLLHVTQPTLSRQLMQLEEELDTKLFLRSNHNTSSLRMECCSSAGPRRSSRWWMRTERDFLREEGQLTGKITIGSGDLLQHRLSGRPDCCLPPGPSAGALRTVQRKCGQYQREDRTGPAGYRPAGRAGGYSPV